MAEVTVAKGEIAIAEVMNLLEAEPANSQPSGLINPGPDIAALREQLALLVSTGRPKEAIGEANTRAGEATDRQRCREIWKKVCDLRGLKHN